MVQKFFRIFTVLNLLFLFSCSPEKNEAVLSVDRIDRIDTFVYTDSGDLLDLIGQKKDFVLTIAQVGCETCKRIQAPMKAYIQTTSLPIYWIEIQEYRKTVELLSEDEEYRLRSIVASASLLLFDDGKDIRYIEYDPKIYASEKAFSDPGRKILYGIALSDRQRSGRIRLLRGGNYGSLSFARLFGNRKPDSKSV